MASILQRDTSSLGTVVGIAVVLVAIVGRVAFGWTWSDPESFVPVLIGVVAAAVALWFFIGQMRS